MLLRCNDQHRYYREGIEENVRLINLFGGLRRVALSLRADVVAGVPKQSESGRLEVFRNGELT